MSDTSAKNLLEKADAVGSTSDTLVASDDTSGQKATAVARAVSVLLGVATKSGLSTHVLQSVMNVADTAGKVIAAKRSSSDNVEALNTALKNDIAQLHEAVEEEPSKMPSATEASDVSKTPKEALKAAAAPEPAPAPAPVESAPAPVREEPVPAAEPEPVAEEPVVVTGPQRAFPAAPPIIIRANTILPGIPTQHVSLGRLNAPVFMGGYGGMGGYGMGGYGNNGYPGAYPERRRRHRHRRRHRD